MSSQPEHTFITLQPFSICTPSDNPHELLILNCASCRQRGEQSRLEFQKNGWVLMKDPNFQSHDGFPVCPQCQGRSYTWEDLY